MAKPDVNSPTENNPLAGLLSANDLQKLVAHHEIEQMEARSHARSAAEEAKKAKMDLLRQRRELTPDMVQRALMRWQNAARQGGTEIELMRFPSELCSDDGRAINNGEAGWEHTLVGVPQQLYEIWNEHLKPRGFKLKAYIVDFPGGKPGDVGMFLSW